MKAVKHEENDEHWDYKIYLTQSYKPEILLKQLVTSVSVIIIIFTSPLRGLGNIFNDSHLDFGD